MLWMFTKRTNLRHSWQLLMDLDLLDYQTFWEQSASSGPSSAMDSLRLLVCVLCVMAWHVCVRGPVVRWWLGDERLGTRGWRGGVNHPGGCLCHWRMLPLSRSLTDWLRHSALTTDSCPRAGPVREIWHLTANDNIDSTWWASDSSAGSTEHQSLPCCIDFKSVSSQCQSEYCLSIVCTPSASHQALSLRSPGRGHSGTGATCQPLSGTANPRLNQQHQSKWQCRHWSIAISKALINDILQHVWRTHSPQFIYQIVYIQF